MAQYEIEKADPKAMQEAVPGKSCEELPVKMMRRF
jgi:hypothetical protein